MKKQLLAVAVCVAASAFGQGQKLAVAGMGALAEQGRISGEGAPAYELVSFVAAPAEGQGISLKWNTAAEPGGTTFTVQRSTDRMNWRTAFTVDGEGPGSGYRHYAAMDLAPLEGIAYYRLLAAANGAPLETSDDFAVEYRTRPAMLVQASHDPGRFTVQAEGSIRDVQLMNNRGQFMPMELEYDGNSVLVRTQGLEPGTYFVQAVVNGAPAMRAVQVTPTGVFGG